MSQGDLETIGRFRVERLLGSGGMGAVYLAEDPILKRRVAVKVVQGGGSQKEAMARFHREAEVSARLNHPNVITIYDVGEDPKIGPFIAMEFVDGSSLAELVEARTLQGDVHRIRILINAMRAVEAAHAAGIVHRDIKPGNLMVGSDGRVKLMDFGVAREEDSGLTMTGAVIGTPAYISPEQLKGASPSAATDCYAFFVMAFEVFTAIKPFSGPATVTLLYNIAHQPPAFPDGFSPALRKVFDQALAKQQKDRHPDLRTFLAALIHAAVGDPAESDRLLHDIGYTGAGSVAAREGSDAPRMATVPKIAEGLGGRGLALMGIATAAVVVAAGGGFYAFSGARSAGVEAPIVVAAATPLAATPLAVPSAVPTHRTISSVSSRENTIPPAAATQPPVVTSASPVPTVAPSVPSAEISPLAVVSIDRPSLEPTFAPRILPTPNATQFRDAVSDALREQGMRHVQVRLTDGDHLILSDLRSPAEAARARALAARITDGELNIETALRETPRPSPRKVAKPVVTDEPAREEAQAPQWEIRPEGAERTD